MSWFSPRPVLLGFDVDVRPNGDIEVKARWPEPGDDREADRAARDVTTLAWALSNGVLLPNLREAIRARGGLVALDANGRLAALLDSRGRVREAPLVCPTKVFSVEGS